MQVCAISPMTMSWWMPCFLSCRSRSVLAKPLEHQCSEATISPGSGTNSARNSPPHVPNSKALVFPRALLNGRNVFPRLVVARAVATVHGIKNPELRLARGMDDFQHVGNAIVRFGNGLDAGPDLAALGNEVVVGIDH